MAVTPKTRAIVGVSLSREGQVLTQFGKCLRRFQFDVGGRATVGAVKASMLMKQQRRLQSLLSKGLLWCLISCYWTSFLCPVGLETAGGAVGKFIEQHHGIRDV